MKSAEIRESLADNSNCEEGRRTDLCVYPLSSLSSTPDPNTTTTSSWQSPFNSSWLTDVRTPRSLLSFVLRILSAMKRRFFLHHSYKDHISTPPTRETAWLDGVRGLASCAVYIFHSSIDWGFAGKEHLNYGWTANTSSNQWWRLPYIRLTYASGSLMVPIFFIVSGFVLTQKGLAQIRHRQDEALLKNVSSAALRRIPRIWLPVVFITWLHLSLSQAGIGTVRGFSLKENYWLQILDWIAALNRAMNPFSYTQRQQKFIYGRSVWTLPLEIYGSFVSYMLLIVMARMTRMSLRLATLAGIALYANYHGSWFMVMFLLGMMLADYDLHRQAINPAMKSACKASASLHTWVWSTILLVALYLAGIQDCYAPFHKNIPRGVTLLCLSAWLIMLSIYHLSLVRGFFETRPLQLLGWLSYPLYLCHYPVLDLISLPYIRPWIYSTMASYPGLSGWITFLVEAFLVLLVSWTFARYIDDPCVKLVRWVDSKIISESTSSPSLPRYSVEVTRPLTNHDKSFDFNSQSAS